MLHLRPLSVGETVDAAFALYRRHLGAFSSAPLLAYVPPMLVWVAYTALAPGMAQPELAYAACSLLAGLLTLVANGLAIGALTRLAADAYLGNPVSRRAAFSWARRRFWPVLGTVLVTGIVVTIGMLLLVVPGVLAAIMLFGAVPVVVLEQRGPVEALDRSERLAKGAWLHVGLALLLLFCIAWIPTLGIVFGYGALMGVFFPSAMGSVAFQGSSEVLGLLANVVALPISTLGTTLLYYDRRVRAEAFGLDLGPDPAAALPEPAATAG